MAQNRILVIDSDLYRTSDVEATLRSAGFEIFRQKHGDPVIEAIRAQEVQLVVIPCCRQEFNGLDLCRKLRLARILQPILLLGKSSESSELISGLEAGADDFIYIPFFAPELVARVRALLRRSVPSAPLIPMRFVVQIDDVEIDFDRLRASRDGFAIDVTPTEFRILRFLVEHRKMACSRQQLSNAIYSDGDNPARERTIDVHIRRLREKLESDPANPSWLLTVRGAGYMFHW